MHETDDLKRHLLPPFSRELGVVLTEVTPDVVTGIIVQPMQTSPGKVHWMSRRSRPHYCHGLGWISGVAFEGTLTRPKQPAQGFTPVRCCGSSRASSPHGLAATNRHLTIPVSCSCLRLAVATNAPRKGLPPPIQCPCRAHLHDDPKPAEPHTQRGAFPRRSGGRLNAD